MSRTLYKRCLTTGHGLRIGPNPPQVSNELSPGGQGTWGGGGGVRSCPQAPV